MELTEKDFPAEKVAAIKKRCHELEKELTGNLSEDLETLAVIRNLRRSVGLYVTEFGDEGCIYCSG